MKRYISRHYREIRFDIVVAIVSLRYSRERERERERVIYIQLCAIFIINLRITCRYSIKMFDAAILRRYYLLRGIDENRT
ncbi:hypothetical protein PUN28_011029 [Cardiocondyla obscurior]|uniref:Uncharacterized protein n=1 Tax=Cardiocondyla obscurior TaxID=286306 RepID=A0AAW2FL08_9HYME